MNHSSYGGSGIGSGSSGNDSQFNHNLNYQFKNNEAYGSVNTQTLRKRRTTTSKASSKSKTTLQRKNKHSLKPNSKPTNCSLYRYNYQIFILVLPCLLSIFLPPNNNNNNDNNVLLILTLYSVLILYIFDLANWKDGFHITIWITLFVLFCFLCWDSFWSYGNDFGSYRSILNGNSNGNNGGYDEYWEMESWSTFLLSIWNWTAKVLFFYCLACWTTLQCKWIIIEERAYAKFMEQQLHFCLPISFSTIVSFFIVPYTDKYCTWDAIPFVFMTSLCFSMNWLCNLQSSFTMSDKLIGNHDDDMGRQHQHHHHHHQQHIRDIHNQDLETKFHKDHEENEKVKKYQREQYRLNEYHTIPATLGCTLSYVVFVTPLVIQIISYPIRWNNANLSSPLSSLSSFSSWCTNVLDCIFIVLVTYILHTFYLKCGLWWKKELPNYFRMHLNQNIIPNREMGMKYQKNNKLSSSFTINFGASKSLSIGYDMLPLFFMTEILISRHLIRICHTISHYLHHDEQNISSNVMVFILLHCGVATLGVAYWWMMTQQKSLGMNYDKDEDIDEPFITMLLIASICFGCALSLPWHALLNVLTFALGFGLYIPTKKLRYMVVSLVIVILSMAMIYWNWFRLIDKTVWIIPGIMKVSMLQFHIMLSIGSSSCGIIYSLVLRPQGSVFENIIAKIDIVGMLLVLYTAFVLLVEGVLLHEPLSTSGGILYSNSLVAITSLLLVGIALLLKRYKLVKKITYLLSLSLSVGKIIASTIGNDNRSTESFRTHEYYISSSVIGAFLIFVISAPFIIMQPMHLDKPQRNRFDKNPSHSLPKGASRFIASYSTILLPCAIAISIARVLKPFISILLGGGRETYYTYSLLTSEMLGYSFSIWGICVYSMLQYHFPNGGAKIWRLGSLSSFLFGIFICFTAPTFLIFESHDYSSSLMFASVSSAGSVIQGYDMKGYWGLVVAALSIMLALVGPLNLSKSNISSVRDKMCFTRFITFSILFGCGSSWFLIFQLIGDLPKFDTIIIVSSAMLTGVMYTMTSMFGYYLDEKDFGETVQMVKISMAVALISTLLSGLLFHLSTANAGESLSTLLLLWGLCSLLLAVAIRSRRQKNVKTRALVNGSLVLSWSLWTLVLYCYFGIANVGVSTGYILGTPISTVFTFPLSSILLLVEDEPKQRYAKSIGLKKPTYFGIRMKTMSDQQRYLLPVVVTGMTLILASLYTVLVRGAGSQWFTWGVHNTYEGIFKRNYGRESRITHHENITAMVQKQLSQYRMVAVTSKLAASGFWTSSNRTGPIVHLLGLTSILPTWYSLCSFAFKAIPEVSHSTFITSLPFNLFPVCFCRGIPSLTVTVYLGIAVALYRYFTLKQQNWINKIAI